MSSIPLHDFVIADSTIDKDDFSDKEDYFEEVENYEDSPTYVFSSEIEPHIEDLNNEMGIERFSTVPSEGVVGNCVSCIDILDDKGCSVISILPGKDELLVELSEGIDIDEDKELIESLVGDVSVVTNNDVDRALDYLWNKVVE